MKRPTDTKFSLTHRLSSLVWTAALSTQDYKLLVVEVVVVDL